MEKESQFSSNNFPDVIDPGITIPIYEETFDSQISPSQNQKLGSYRLRAGKFSNTLSNLLPSISAKLHSKKSSGGKSNADDSFTGGSSESVVDLKAPKGSIAKTKTSELKSILKSIVNSNDITPPNETTKLVHFPTPSDYLMTPQQRPSSDSYTFSSDISQQQFMRRRGNTGSLQVQPLSSSNSIWASSSVGSSDPFQGYVSQQVNAAPLNDYQKGSLYYEQLLPSSTSNSNALVMDNVSIASSLLTNVNTNLGIPNSSNIWTNNTNTTRQRSFSNSSSIYTDAQPYVQMGMRPRAASTYAGPRQSVEVPLLADNVDPRSINWITADLSAPPINQVSNLLPTNTISISNVYLLQEQQPQLSSAINLTSTSLATLCSKFGEVQSARVLKGINMALVEFDSIDSAVHALEALQGKEVSMLGFPSTVSFAKVLPTHHQQQTFYPAPSNVSGEGTHQPLLQEQLYSGAVTFLQQGNVTIPVFNQFYRQQQQQQQQQHQQQLNGASPGNTHNSHNNAADKELNPFNLQPPPIKDKMDSLRQVIAQFGVAHDDEQIESLLSRVLNFKGTSTTTDFGPLPEPLPSKDFDAPKLREVRRAIDSETMSDLELEQLAMAMLDELPELCSDYLGNTVVQKLFDVSSDIIKDIMLRKISKYLTSMGIHKNGAWACQKIIASATTPRQMKLVTDGIHNYCTPLFNDQFGNYVIQCVLKYGFPHNSFIFESILANFWTIAQNRYGVRAVRACLEAHNIITIEQTLALSACIVLYSEYLAANSNGSLMLTWLLDTCNLPKRHEILAQNIAEHIIDICRHRLASLTVLKILGYRGDDVARKIILRSIFGDAHSEEPSPELKQIICDTSYGSTFIYKLLLIPVLEPETKTRIIQCLRKLLQDVPSAQQHRRLMEEVGLAPPNNLPQNNQAKARKNSSSHGFNQDMGVNHLRAMSTASVLSNGSRPTSMLNQVPPMNQLPMPPSGNGSNANPVGYYNYPGMFPFNEYGNGVPNTSNASNSTVVLNGVDTVASNLDSLHLGNESNGGGAGAGTGANAALPQVSVTNPSNSTNYLNINMDGTVN